MRVSVWSARSCTMTWSWLAPGRWRARVAVLSWGTTAMHRTFIAALVATVLPALVLAPALRPMRQRARPKKPSPRASRRTRTPAPTAHRPPPVLDPGRDRTHRHWRTAPTVRTYRCATQGGRGRTESGCARRRPRRGRARQVGDARHHRRAFASGRGTASARSHSDGNEATAPTTPGVWAEHSVWPQDPGFATALAGGVTCCRCCPVRRI